MVKMIMELVRNRSFTLTTSDSKQSKLRRLKNGVPQRSVLAPLLFNTYTYDLPSMISKNVVKLSYSCTPNMANILAAHNKRLLKSRNGKSEFKLCNYRYKPSCLLNGNCRDKAIVYQATVQTKDQSKNYI